MKIGMNSIGNYSPFQFSGINKTAQSAKTEAIADPVITSDEKNFFAAKYPGSRDEIMQHHFYGRSGQMSGISVGTLFNRRG